VGRRSDRSALPFTYPVNGEYHHQRPFVYRFGKEVRVRVVFADERVHRLCSEPARAAAFWGASWARLTICLALLVDSADFAHLRTWHALDVQPAGGRIRVAHR